MLNEGNDIRIRYGFTNINFKSRPKTCKERNARTDGKTIKKAKVKRVVPRWVKMEAIQGVGVLL